MISAIVAALAGAFKLVAEWMRISRDKLLISLGATQQLAKSNEADAATQSAIKDVADERSAIADAATDPDDLAREFREQKTGSGPTTRKRPF